MGSEARTRKKEGGNTGAEAQGEVQRDQGGEGALGGAVIVPEQHQASSSQI